MDNENKIPALTPGLYRHYKGKDYTVFGLATFLARFNMNQEAERTEKQKWIAVMSGTESEEHPTYLTIYELSGGGWVFHAANLGIEDLIVVYKPNYGNEKVTFRGFTEFTEMVGEVPRFAFQGRC